MDGKDVTAENGNTGSCTGEEEPKERDMISEKKDEVSFLMIFCQTSFDSPRR